MCSEAFDDGLINSNPAVGLGRWVGVRADNSNLNGREKVGRPFSEADLARFLSVSREVCSNYFPLFLTLARTGCRPGEALALRWSDLNFDRREIVIERAFSAGQLGPTKTGKSRRLDMSRELALILHQLGTDRAREFARERGNEMPEWVFVNSAGKPIHEDTPRRVFARALQQAGISRHTVYDLRHTFATLHLAKGHPITYVSAQLGHSDPSTTLRWYAHWLPTHDRRFADSLDVADSDSQHRPGVCLAMSETLRG